MTEEQQLKLQAFLDGELPENDAREVAARVARDAEAADLLAELRNTRQALSEAESVLKVPESREFYWSNIEREIQSLPSTAPISSAFSLAGLVRRLLVPTGATAALALLAIVVGLRFGWLGPTSRPDTEIILADSGAFTYHDYANGTTLVWLSYPAER